MRVSILAVTDGQVIEYPPEIYLDAEQAIREAEHWAWVLSAGGSSEVRRPFDGRWEVGIRDVRVVAVIGQDFDSGRDWWVGIHWVADGYPDPDCVLLDGSSRAREWVLAAAASGEEAANIHEDPWLVSATFATRGGESQSVALRAKVIATQSSEPVQSSADYEVSLVGTFVQSIHGRVKGPPGLARPEIEELVERDWAGLSTETDVLLDSSWELKTFRELQS